MFLDQRFKWNLLEAFRQLYPRLLLLRQITMSFQLMLAGLCLRYETDAPFPSALCGNYPAPPDAAADVTIPLPAGTVPDEKLLLRLTADALLPRDRLLMHGAALAWQGQAYLFTAPSGTGKSTHAMLWRRYLGSGAEVINGDKPLLHLPPDGPAVVYGSPWAG